MNKTYRVIWNASTRTWNAVSELATGRKKSSHNVLRVAIPLLLGAGLVPLPAVAQYSAGGGSATGSGAAAIGANCGTAPSATGSNSIAFGCGAEALASGAAMDSQVAIGDGAGARGIRSIAIGASASAGTFSAAGGGGDNIAIGFNAQADTTGGNNSVAIGHNAVAANGSLALGAGASAVANARDVALGGGSQTATVVNTTGATIGGQSYTFAGTSASSTVSVGASGSERTITNVAAGRITGTSTDAVNGSQLNATNQSVNTLDGRTTQNSRDITTLTNNLGNGTVGLVQQAAAGADLTVGKDTDGSNVSFADRSGNTRTLTNVSAGVSDSDAVNVSQLKRSGLIGSDGHARAALTYDQNADGTANYSRVTMGGGMSTGPVTIRNVAAGVDDTDAVNVAQLKGTGLIGAGGDMMDAVVYDAGSNKTQVTLGGFGKGGGPVILANVANGNSQYDAVNFGQLQTLQDQVSSIDGRVTTVESRIIPYFNATGNPQDGSGEAVANAAAPPGTGSTAVGGGAAVSGNYGTAVGSNASAVADNSVAVGAGAQATGANSVALGQGSVADRDNSVSVGSTGQARQITNVAAGTESTDAVNVGQLNGAISDVQGNLSNAINSVRSDMNSLRNDANAGTSSAIAMANLPHASLPGESMVSVAGGTYAGQSAVAFGVSTATANRKWIIKASGSTNTRGTVGVGAGAGYRW